MQSICLTDRREGLRGSELVRLPLRDVDSREDREGRLGTAQERVRIITTPEQLRNKSSDDHQPCCVSLCDSYLLMHDCLYSFFVHSSHIHPTTYALQHEAVQCVKRSEDSREA
jgi:hypothetical protein